MSGSNDDIGVLPTRNYKDLNPSHTREDSTPIGTSKDKVHFYA